MKPFKMRKHVVRVIAVASVLFAAYVLVPAAGYAGPGPAENTDAAQASPGKRTPARPREDIRGLPNFAQVSDGLYRGAQPDAGGFRELKRLGVKTIVNLRSLHSDDEMVEGLGFNYVALKMNYLDPRDGQIAQFLKVMDDPALQPVFVHCRHGSDRTGTVVAAYRMVVQGWDRASAMDELPVFGFHEIWQSLRAYLEGFDAVKIGDLAKKVQMPSIKRIN